MRVVCLTLLLLACVACDERNARAGKEDPSPLTPLKIPTAPEAGPMATGAPDPAPKPLAAHVSEDELNQFFDGMLVTSNIQRPNEPAWPVGDRGLLPQWLGETFKTKFGLKSNDELRRFIDVPVEKMNRGHGWVLERLKDWPTALKFWKRMLAEDPNDLEAALNVAQLVMSFEGPEAVVDAIAGTSGAKARVVDERAPFNPAQLEGIRCEALLLARRPKEALEACDAAIEIDESFGSRTLAKVLLALGKNKEALVQMEQVRKIPGRKWSWGTMFTLGLAQQANGMQDEALRTWNLALSWWPSNEILKRAISGPKRSVYEWAKDEAGWSRPWRAKELALCGHYYLELGMKDRAEACLSLSEKLEPGPALAHRLVFLGQTNPEKARVKALAAAKRSPHIDLKTAVAWLYLKENNVPEARAWVDRALELQPWNVQAMSLKWQICGEEKDYVCVIEYRKRLGLPTHFNAEEYREAAKAWKEQAIRNGEHLAAEEPSSAEEPKPPRLDQIVIVPLSPRTPAELDGAADLLSAVFPGVKFTVAPPEDLPRGAYKIERDQIVWEVLQERLRAEPGRLYVVEQDLGTLHGRFLFAKYDLGTGRGVISLSRLRSLVGAPISNPVVDDLVVEAVRHRLRSELVAGAARLLGSSYPCEDAGCALHAHRAVTDFVLADSPFCAKHAAEVKALIEARHRQETAAHEAP